VALSAACVYGLVAFPVYRYYFIAYNASVLVLNHVFKSSFDLIETSLGINKARRDAKVKMS
jgi:hypothetical protein